MASWGAIAVTWPADGYTLPLVTFDVPTGLPPTRTIEEAGGNVPDRYGAARIADLPPLRALNSAPPRARWRGAGLYAIEALLDGQPAGVASAPFGDTASVRLWELIYGGFVAGAAHTLTLRAHVELTPPARETIYKGETVLPLSAPDGFLWFSLDDVARRDVYPDDYPAGELDAYGRPIAAGDTFGSFGANVRGQFIHPGEAFPDLVQAETVFYPPVTATFDSPAVAVQYVAPPAGDGEGGAGGGGSPPPPDGSGGGGGASGEPPPTPPPPPPPDAFAPARTFTFVPPPNWIDAGGDQFQTTAPAGTRSFARAPSPGRTNPDEPVTAHKGRWEPTYRQFWQQLIWGSADANRKTHALLKKTRHRGRRRRR